MKATTYIFGNFADGYSQYPDNYTRDLFAPIAKSRKGATELIFHRDGGLTYYIYTREISRSAKTFIGLCYVFNDILITDFSFLFNVFEDAITNIVVQGELLEFTNDGDLATKVNELYAHAEELQRISDYLNSKLSTIGRYAEKLPAQNFAVPTSEWKNFSFEELEEAQSATRKYYNIRVIKGENYETDTLKGYAYKLRTQNNEIKSLSNDISKLKDEIVTLKRQKKQIKWVLFLLILLIIGGIGFYVYAQKKIQIIQDKSEIIESLDLKIQNQEIYIYSLREDSTNLSNALTIKTNQLEEANQKLNNISGYINEIFTPYTYFSSWESTNYHKPNSKSQIVYAFYAHKDDELTIPYYVSSEENYDFLIITLKRNGYAEQQLVKESGVLSSTYKHTFYASGSYQLIITYEKEKDTDRNRDCAGVRQIYIYSPIINQLSQLEEESEASY